jgi:hypothetical protein
MSPAALSIIGTFSKNEGERSEGWIDDISSPLRQTAPKDPGVGHIVYLVLIIIVFSAQFFGFPPLVLHTPRGNDYAIFPISSPSFSALGTQYRKQFISVPLKLPVLTFLSLAH